MGHKAKQVLTIVAYEKLRDYHPALGRVYAVTFNDGNTRRIYEETFYDQIDHEWGIDDTKETTLIGQRINLTNAYILH